MESQTCRKLSAFSQDTYQPDLIEESLVKDTLKLAYVALSRRRYFAGVAMHEENFSIQNIQDAVRFGWRIVKVNDYLDIIQA